MRKLLFPALLAAAVVALTAFDRPPVNELVEGPLPKCGANSDICLGSSNSQVQTNGNLLVNKPILVGPSSSTATIVIDAGVTVVGTVTLGTEKVDVLDAGVARFNGTVQLTAPTNCGAAAACGTVALVSGTPSTATATVVAGSTCFCWPVGNTAVIAAGGCAASVSSTTATFTGPNTVTTTVGYLCIK